MSNKEMSLAQEMKVVPQKAEELASESDSAEKAKEIKALATSTSPGSKNGTVGAAQTSKQIEQVPRGVMETEAESFPADNIPAVWLRVLDLMDCSDKKNFTKASSAWHGWTASQRTTVHFPEVVPFLMETLPPHKSILKCRELFQSCTAELDSQFQTHPSHLRFNFEWGVEYTPVLSNRFTAADEIKKFMQEMESNPGNPFPGRNVVLKLEIPDPTPEETRFRLCTEFWTNTILMLERFGRHVHIVTIDLDESEMLGVEADENFRKCLILLPHLKRLNVVGDGRGASEEVQNFYRANVMPTLHSLETVHMYLVTRALSNAVLGSCCVSQNMKRLYLVECEGRELCEAAYRFSNLEVLKACFDIEDLERLANQLQPPPLREVDLYFYGSPDFQQVCTSLELFSDTLVNIQISPASVEEIELRLGTAEEFRVNFPKVEMLVLEDYYGPLDLFLQLPSLTHLEILCHGLLPYEESIVDFFGFERWMLESNIWTLIPTLKTFVIEIYGHFHGVFNREEIHTGENGN